jgi:hypothetical protein
MEPRVIFGQDFHGRVLTFTKPMRFAVRRGDNSGSNVADYGRESHGGSHLSQRLGAAGGP